MKIVSISVYAAKSKRKNAKRECKIYQCFPDSTERKRRFTNDDMIDIQRWIGTQLDKGYEYFQVVVEDGTTLSGDNSTPVCIVMCPESHIPLNGYIAAVHVINYMNLYNHALASNYTSRV